MSSEPERVTGDDYTVFVDPGSGGDLYPDHAHRRACRGHGEGGICAPPRSSGEVEECCCGGG